AFSLCSASCVGEKWRLKHKLPKNPTSYGPYVDLADWSFADGRPGALWRNQRNRILQQKQVAEEIYRHMEEIDFAVARHQKLQYEAEEAHQQKVEQKLKPKGELQKKVSSSVAIANRTLEQPDHSDFITLCQNLNMGQYLCLDLSIDPDTQQPRGCTKENVALVNCTAAEGILCTETNSSVFKRPIPCKWTNGHSFETALLLSVFLGMFGVDRFYLGYPAIGILKFCTLGFMFLGQLIDIILIATQVLRPSDGSHYVINYFGPQLEILSSNNMTYKLPQGDW
ncbi:unnamed protein product, partial [Darwinula stevensoni]